MKGSTANGYITKGSILQAISGRPTLVLEPNMFRLFMQAAAIGQHGYPIVNNYGYGNDSIPQTEYRVWSYDSVIEKGNVRDIRRFLAGAVTSTGAGRVIYVETARYPFSSKGLEALYATFGKPIVRQKHAILWSVPPKIRAVWVSGDVWNVESMFSGYHAVGNAWGIHTQGERAEVELKVSGAAQAAADLRLKMGQRVWHVLLVPGRIARVPVPANAALFVQDAPKVAPANTANAADGKGAVAGGTTVLMKVRIG